MRTACTATSVSVRRVIPETARTATANTPEIKQTRFTDNKV
jgi:hypothetical protein